MREDQSKRNSNPMNPGRDTTQWSENENPRDEHQGGSYGRMNQSGSQSYDQSNRDSKYSGQSYRNDDYYNRPSSRGYQGSDSNIDRSRYSSGPSDYSQRSQIPYEQASYGRDLSDNFSGGTSSRGMSQQDQWNQRGRQSGFGQANQQDQSYGQQYGRPYSGSESSQPRGADQGSYGQDTGASSRYQGGYSSGYEASNRQRGEGNYQDRSQGGDQDQQDYRGNESQRSIYGSAGFGSLGSGSEMPRGRSESDSRGYGGTYHPDAHYGYVPGYSSSGSRSMSSSEGLSGKQTPASYYGKGPKSYKRSDERIREEISEMFTRHSDIDASDVEIEVKDGEVILSGFVLERRMKYLAEDLAEKSMGVKDVTNNLRVRRESSISEDMKTSPSTSSESAAAESMPSESVSTTDADKSDKKMNIPGTTGSKKGTPASPSH